MDPETPLPSEDRGGAYPHARLPENRENPDLPPISPERLHEGISRAMDHLLSLQSAEGYWVFDLEADVKIGRAHV